ncbi:hypothetical protein L2E82_02789 [Cichorium intybus]|uniref:Uncharacterized protein n=1 Tax=Cichorium intybus TaxID=13427 RepID=A0ACB9H479_CICIN|nr:hypothetical protein L2E82_02789 [Cichorium intybus]
MSIPSLLMFSLLFVTSSASDHDFCVADLSQPDTPSGFACKDVKKVTAQDFLFRLGTPENMNNTFKYAITLASAVEFPGTNGLRLSMARLDIAPSGVFPMHTHRGANEILFVESGTMTVGFISSDNTVYSKTLNKWDIFVFPQGLLHFLVNSGKVTAIAVASFSSSRPGLQFLDSALFSNSLPSEVVEATTLLDPKEVEKLKGVFGGSG